LRVFNIRNALFSFRKICLDQRFPNCAPCIPRYSRPIPRRSVDTLL